MSLYSCLNSRHASYPREAAVCPVPRVGESGVALLMAIVAVFLLSLAVLETRAGVDLYERIAYSMADELQTQYLARSGLSLLQGALGEDDVSVDSYSDDWAAVNQAGPLPLGDLGWVAARVEDEEGKLDINGLVDSDGSPDEENPDSMFYRLRTLLDSLGLPSQRTDEIVDSLIDWIDPDSSPRPYGAEDEYYTTLPVPYSCPNDDVVTIGELALVKGIGSTLLDRGEGDIPPLRRFLTIYGDGSGLVNINTAPVEVLMSLTPEGTEYSITREIAEDILAARDEEPFENKNEIKARVVEFHEDLFNQVSGLIDTRSSHFSAQIIGESERSSSTVYGVLSRAEDGSVNLVYYRGF